MFPLAYNLLRALTDTSTQREEARRQMREAEDAFVAGRSRQWKVTRALEQRAHRPKSGNRQASNKALKQAKNLPEGCIDLLVEDHQAEEEERRLER